MPDPSGRGHDFSMNNLQAIGTLLGDLERSASLEAALMDTVRLACEASGCQAAALAADLDAVVDEGWFTHDPDGVMGAAGGERQESSPRFRQEPTGAADRTFRRIRIPITCGADPIGGLLLLTTKGCRRESITERISGLTALLGLLLAAAENSACHRMTNVFSRPAFRARVSSELSRARRCEQEFSLLHARLAGPKATGRDSKSGRWSAAAAIAESLAGRLRSSDVVGLTAPDRLTILLAATGRVGARIASRRIEQLMLELIEDAGSAELRSAAPQMSFLVFPQNAEQIEDFCRVKAGVDAAAETALCGEAVG